MRQPRTTRVGASEPRGLAAVELHADVLRAIRRADVSALDFWLVVATDVGELRPRARRAKSGAVETAFVRRTARELAGRLAATGIQLGPADVEERVDGARARLHDELEARGLLLSAMRVTSGFAPPLLHLRAEGSPE